VVLHDGDTISLGDSTVLQVSISHANCPAAAAAPAATAARAGAAAGAPTVESFLNAQCEATCARFQVRALTLDACRHAALCADAAVCTGDRSN
jgi:hypothetical protein